MQLQKAQQSNKSSLTNFWKLGPAPFTGAHFATFHPRIPEIAILAGTSERGVCPKCAAPWERVVEKRLVPDGNRRSYAGSKAKDSDGNDHGSNIYRDGHLPGRNQVETINWRPTCDCHCVPIANGNPQPATVLDPFLGAGTTALVADRLGRHCIGIELSPQYAEMARKRIADDAGMFAEIAAE